MRAVVETEHWVVMGNTKAQEIRRENVNHSLEFHNLHNSLVGNQNLFEEHYQNLPLD